MEGRATIAAVVLEVADVPAADRFSTTAFGLGDEPALRASQDSSTGFHGFVMAFTVFQPADVDHLIAAVRDAGSGRECAVPAVGD